jgi:peroxidase
VKFAEQAAANGVVVVPIPDDANDPFRAANCHNITITRSQFVPNTVRQQVNELTSFIDGSVVYGSDLTRANALRTLSAGKLKTQKSGLLLPNNTLGLQNGPNTSPGFFLAGDVRVNEQPGLIAIHTLFVREHNLLATDLKKAFPAATDEQLYQMARKIVGAEIQAITYNEFLPALLGPMAPQMSTYSGFNASVDPSISTEFSTAAFRFGHTMLSPTFQFANQAGLTAQTLEMKDSFFNPGFFMQSPAKIDDVLGGLQEGLAQELDPMITDAVRNFLFGTPNGPNTCLDLTVLNIMVRSTCNFGKKPTSRLLVLMSFLGLFCLHPNNNVERTRSWPSRLQRYSCSIWVAEVS